jgi:hypothetical protein
VDEALDVALVVRLRPASLVVPAGLLFGAVEELLEPSAAEPLDRPALASDNGHEGAVVAAH